MADVTGAGSSFGGALRSALGKVSLGAARESYTRATTEGRFRQLFGREKGYQAMQSAGLDVKQSRTFAGWLDGTSHPNKANSAAIDRAYKAMAAGGTPGWVRGGQMDVKGIVGTGRDVRERGSGSNPSPFRIDMSQASGSGWDAVDEALASGTDDDIEETFTDEVISEDLAGSDGWSFPGSSYTVSVTS